MNSRAADAGRASRSMLVRPSAAPRGPALLFGLVVLAVFGAAYLAFEAQKKDIKTRAERSLADVAVLKASQISQWLGERKGDARVFSDRTPFTQVMDRWLRNGGKNEADRRLLAARISMIAKAYDYDALLVFDAVGQVRLSTREPAAAASHERDLALAAMRARETILGEIRLDGGLATVGLVAPMFVGDEKSSRVAGAIYFRIDPARFLFPLIHSWPIESETAETVLVRRDGDEVRLLSRLRHSDAPPLSFHAPLNDSDLLASQLFQGKVGFASGKDYRGHRVVGYLLRIPGSEWGLVAKVDEAEIYAPIRRLAFNIAVAMLLLLSFLAYVFWSLRTRAAQLQLQYQAELRARALGRLAETALQQHELITRNMQEGVLLGRLDDGVIVYSNPKFDAMFGYTPGELQGHHVSCINAPTDEAPEEIARRINDSLQRTGKWSGEVRNVRKDGTMFWCNATVSTFEHPDHGKVWLTIHLDITERKNLEDARSENLKRIRELSQRLVAIQESERRKLGAELHDRTAANLATMHLLLKDLGGRLPASGNSALLHSMEDIQALMADTTATIRDISTDLHPPLLQYLGLDAALKDLAGRFAQRLGIPVEVCMAGTPRVDEGLQTALYRIAQEALTNCAKHAAAKSIGIELAEEGDGISLTIRDDGAGFTEGAAARATGLGIVSMRERTELSGGRFRIDSFPGRGTTVRADFPRAACAPAPSAVG